jgi:hypothetical protein
MLVIRNEQMQAMQKFSVGEFENELVVHIKEFAPKHSEVIKDEGVREVVRLGIERSKNYGFTNRGPVRFYVELMFMFGSDFDTDFQLPWAGGTLKNEVIKEQSQRADILHDKMTEYLEAVAGPDDRYALDSLRRLSHARYEDYQNPAEHFDKRATAALRHIYPEKCDYLGDKLLTAVIRKGKQAAKKHSVKPEKNAALFVALVFALGHGFAGDPLFPWVSKTLQDEAVADADERAERLERKMKIYLNEALKYLEDKKKQSV